MLNCCEKLFLGEFAHSEAKVFTDLVAELSGIYTFELKFNEVIRKIQIPFNQNDILTIPASYYLNEDATYTMNIKDPLGNYIEFMYYNCFTFRVVILLSDCNNCNPYIYGLNIASNTDDDPDFELGRFE